MLHSRSEILAKAISKTSCQSNKQTFMPPPLPPSLPPFSHRFQAWMSQQQEGRYYYLTGNWTQTSILGARSYTHPTIIPWQRIYCNFYSWHSHKKRKTSLEGSLDRVLLATELEFPKILEPRLPQHTSDGNIECAGKSVWSKQLCYLHVTSLLEHWYILLLLFWY